MRIQRSVLHSFNCAPFPFNYRQNHHLRWVDARGRLARGWLRASRQKEGARCFHSVPPGREPSAWLLSTVLPVAILTLSLRTATCGGAKRSLSARKNSLLLAKVACGSATGGVRIRNSMEGPMTDNWPLRSPTRCRTQAGLGARRSRSSIMLMNRVSQELRENCASVGDSRNRSVPVW